MADQRARTRFGLALVDRGDAHDYFGFGIGSLTSATKVTAEHVWLTTPDLTQRLSQRPDIALSATGTATVTLDRTKSLQTLDGFGAAFTDTSNWLIGSKLNTSART